jgi:hypothetical protein
VDVPEMMAKFLESHDDTDMVRKMRSVLEFSCESVVRCYE